MYCRKCGVEMNNNEKFCPNCGEKNILLEKTSISENEKGEDIYLTSHKISGRLVLKISLAFMTILFFCPMLLVSCGEMEIGRFSLLDLAAGIDYMGETEEMVPAAIMFLLLPLFGFVYLFLKSKKDSHGMVSAIVGGISGLSLAGLVITLISRCKSNSDMVSVKVLIPFYVYMILTICMIKIGISLDVCIKKQKAVARGMEINETQLRNKTIQRVAGCVFIGMCILIRICS